VSLKISQMIQTTILSGDELVPIVQSGANFTTPVSALRGPILRPEDYGAVGNANFEDAAGNWFTDAACTIPANNDYTAFKSLYDELNRRRGGYVVCGVNKNYWLNNIVYQPTLTFTSMTITGDDGKTTEGPFFFQLGGVGDGSETLAQALYSDNRAPLFLLGLNGLIWEGNGSLIRCKGNFKLFSGQNQGSFHHKMTMVPFRMQHCDNIIIRNQRLDGEWRKMILELGPTVGQRFDYAIWAYACKNVYLENVRSFDFGMDHLVVGHRYGSQVGSGSFQSTPSLESFTDTVFQSDGWSRNWKLVNCDLDRGGRQGGSPVGVQGFTVIGGSVTNTKLSLSTLPIWKAGDPAGNYQVIGVSPGLAWDFEPDRTYPDAVTDVLLIGHKMANNVSGAIGASGNAHRNGGDLTVAPGDIDTGTDVITVASHGLPDFSTGNRIRVRNSGGGLPAPLATYTDYWVTYLSSSTFKLSNTKEDAAALVYIDLTTQGTGTHFFTVYDGIASVGSITLADCDIDHPPEGSNTPFTCDCVSFRMIGGTMKLRPSGAFVEFNETLGRIDARFEGVKFNAAGKLLAHSSGNAYFLGVKTVALPGGVTIGTDTITIVAHGYGKYDNTPVWVKATTLPAPLEYGVEYYVIKVDDDNFKLAYTIEQAKAGTAIDLTSAGTGTLSVSPLNGSMYSINNCEVETYERPRFFKPEHVNTTTNYINMEGFDRATTDSVVFATTGGLPAPLVAGTTYFIIRDLGNNTKFRLATSSANASAGTAIDLTTQGTGMHEMRNGPLINLISAEGPAFKFTNNRVFIAHYNHARTLTSQGQVSFLRNSKNSVFGNEYITDLRNESPARDFNLLYVDEIDSAIHGERVGDQLGGWTVTYSGQAPVLKEAITRILTSVSNITPALVAANTTAEQTFTVTGLKTTDIVVVQDDIAGTAGLAIVGARVTAANTLGIRWMNNTAGGLTPTAGNRDIVIFRQGA
jgi:hypothetical protein